MKDKTKKVLKTIGLVVLALLASLGVVLGGMLIGEMGKGNTKPVLMEEERTSLRSSPKKTLDGGSSVNLPYQTWENRRVNDYSVPNMTFTFQWDTDVELRYWYIPAGYYYYDYQGLYSGNTTWAFGYSGLMSPSLWAEVLEFGNSHPVTFTKAVDQEAMDSIQGTGFSRYFLTDTDMVFFASGNPGKEYIGSAYLYSVYEYPAIGKITLPHNWAPMGYLSADVSTLGGYAFYDGGSATSSTYVTKVVSMDMLFRAGGEVFDGIELVYNDLSHGTGYIDEDGNAVKPWEGVSVSSVHVFGLTAVNYKRSYSGLPSVSVLEVVKSSRPYETGDTSGTYYDSVVYLPTGAYRFVQDNYRYIDLLDGGDGVGQRVSGRFNNVSDWLLLANGASYTSVAVEIKADNVYDAFDLMKTAFGSFAPILSISILPNITLGLLIFLPLIGGIIVLIIKAVKK